MKIVIAGNDGLIAGTGMDDLVEIKQPCAVVVFENEDDMAEFYNGDIKWAVEGEVNAEVIEIET